MQAWLARARCRLPPGAYHEFRRHLRRLHAAVRSKAKARRALAEPGDTGELEAYAPAPGFGNCHCRARDGDGLARGCLCGVSELLVLLARSLWQADFPEGQEAKTCWVLAFEDSLPHHLHASWHAVVQSRAPEVPVSHGQAAPAREMAPARP